MDGKAFCGRRARRVDDVANDVIVACLTSSMTSPTRNGDFSPRPATDVYRRNALREERETVYFYFIESYTVEFLRERPMFIEECFSRNPLLLSYRNWNEKPIIFFSRNNSFIHPRKKE